MSDRSDYEIQTNTQRISGINEETVAATTGRPFSFECKTNVTTGGWFNCSKSYMDFDSTGDVTGRASAHNMEMRMPNKTIQRGAYSPVEVNLVFQASSGITNGRPVTFASFNVSGDQGKIDAWEDTTNSQGAVFDFNGLTAAADGGIFENEAPAAIDAALKILIDGVPYWINLSSAHD